MKKIVINSDFGGFSLSYSAVLRYCELAGLEVWPEQSHPEFVSLKDSWHFWLIAPGPERAITGGDSWSNMSLEDRRENNRRLNDQLLRDRDIPRDDAWLVRVVEELGEEANGRYAHLKVVEIPDDVEWEIEEYDGMEHISEAHRTWR